MTTIDPAPIAAAIAAALNDLPRSIENRLAIHPEFLADIADRIAATLSRGDLAERIVSSGLFAEEVAQLVEPDHDALADRIDSAAVARYIDVSDIAEEIDASDIAEHVEIDASDIDLDSLAECIDLETLAEHIDLGALADGLPTPATVQDVEQVRGKVTHLTQRSVALENEVLALQDRLNRLDRDRESSPGLLARLRRLLGLGGRS